MTAAAAYGSVSGAGRRRLAIATERLRAGAPVLVRDDDGATGHLVLAAQSVDGAQLAFLIRHCSGFVRVALADEVCDDLLLPAAYGAARTGGRQCVAVDLVEGVGTGISARDRARTIGRLAAADARADEFTRPGHVVPVRVDPSAPFGDPAEHAFRLVTLAGGSGAAFDTVLPLDRPIDRLGSGVLSGSGLDAFACRFGIHIVDAVDIRRADPRPLAPIRLASPVREAAGPVGARS
ncbi:3,4-dihydroxy-2-butanone-4-phosphate synthase [Millisia brevis]|uniref:3,4-dihydroxy-2-butanone-4-phosphate synthase n=1 Tax=Millisia brevis TaxID=264148 RepID=UPI00083700BD|nr:3,4-dihydroxy-2-butanone-4-phosphate synthase [Millisia brevis]